MKKKTKSAITEKYCASVIPIRDASMFHCLGRDSIQAMMNFSVECGNN